jgi:tetratricopeptide (TPR) repeat protein
MQPTESDLARILSLYERGLYAQAFEAGRVFAPLQQWRGTAARLLAGRLARNLEGYRLGNALLACAWRDDRRHPEARYFFGHTLLAWRGPLSAWEYIQRHRDVAGESTPTRVRADWLGLAARVLSLFRDFDAAEEALQRAERLDADHAWTGVERAYLLERQDRYAESLEAARRALALQPWYRPAVQQAAHMLELLGRDEEALALLSEAVARLESPSVCAQLALLQIESGRPDDAAASLDRYEQLALLIEPAEASWLAGRRCDLAHARGDAAAAREHARRAGRSSFYREIAARLENGAADARRVLLNVPFVRQHHLTCAPATLSALSHYWAMPAGHLEIAEKICYDGTTDHGERQWAEQNAFVAREFTVTWEAAVGLLDAGIPFALATVEPTSAHLQAVIGYDARRGTFSLRDPYRRSLDETLADHWLRRYAGCGPRGLALAPRGHAAARQLEQLALPDAPLFDRYYRLQCALLAHDRAGAHQILDAMSAETPRHRLTLQARRTLAVYDGDQTALLACYNQLLELFPDDQRFLPGKLSCLGLLAPREESLRLLEPLCARPDCDPVFWQRLARLLRQDMREAGAARRWLRRAIRAQPQAAGHYYELACLLWDLRRFDEALQLYRFAASLEDKVEDYARSWFIASQHFKRTAQALRWLEQRFERFGAKSSLPARTLYWALERLDRCDEGLARLDRAIRWRPDDGGLLLFAADAHARYGHQTRAAQLLARAEGKSQRVEWLQTAAELASYRGEHRQELELWRETAALDPLSVNAHRNIARLLAITEGAPAARAHLQRVCERFPHHYGLHQLWIEWWRDEGAEAVEPAARRLVEIDPADAWARRELALTLSAMRRHEEALAECAIAEQLAPSDTATWNVRGIVCKRAGRRPQARAAWQQAIRLSADNDAAIDNLLALCQTAGERREALGLVQAELQRQTIFGDGLLAFRAHGRNLLPAAELLQRLREAHAARPDLWHAWSVLAQQLVTAGQLDEAWNTAREATRRFPLVSRLWLDLADVCLARGDTAGETEALQRALEINPRWSFAARRLAEVWERAGQRQRERATLEQAIARDPLDACNRGYLADLLWRSDEKPAAFEEIKRAVELNPDYDWAWERLREWGRELQQPQAAVEPARELTRRRAGEARSWYVLANALDSRQDHAEVLTALARAIELNPQFIEALDMRASLLAREKQFDEALATCRGPVWENHPPLQLRGRAAWVEAERGNLDEAIRQMQAALADDPDYRWGWQQLADWYGDKDLARECLQAAEQMVRLSPGDAMAYGYRGDARRRNQDVAGAKADFQRAIELDAAYTYAGFELFDLQLAGEELDAAEKTLERLRARAAGPWTLAREIQLAVHPARNQPDRAAGALRELSVTRGDAAWPWRTAVGALRKAGWLDLINRVFAEAICSPQANPLIGWYWIESLTEAGRPWQCWRVLARLRNRHEMWWRGADALFNALGDKRRRAAMLFWLACWRGRLRQPTALWGSVGYALTNANFTRLTAWWMRDWRLRQDLQPWLLLNLAASLRERFRDRAARQVSEHALTLPRDHCSDAHAVWLAYDDALAGRADAARARLDRVQPATLLKYYRCLHALLQLLMDQVSPTPPAWEASRERLDHARSLFQISRREPPLFRVWRRCVWQVAGSRRGWRRLAAVCWALNETFLAPPR